ncbi:hypothetical protein GF324_00825, partial [bacterium]|nr:hypothetical protein [bacterium]
MSTASIAGRTVICLLLSTFLLPFSSFSAEPHSKRSMKEDLIPAEVSGPPMVRGFVGMGPATGGTHLYGTLGATYQTHESVIYTGKLNWVGDFVFGAQPDLSYSGAFSDNFD